MTRHMRRFVVLAVIIAVLGIAVVLHLSRAARHARSLNCASSIVSVCFGGRLWAEEHEGYFPTNFLMMSNELNTPKILCCIPERRVSTWSQFGPRNTTYEVVTPGVDKTNTNAVFVRCTVHGHLGYPDTTVFDGKRRRGKFD